MLADQEHLEKWLKAGKTDIRSDSAPVEALLKSWSDSLHTARLRRPAVWPVNLTPRF